MRSYLIGSACALAACHSAQRIDLCRRGDRVAVASFQMTALDATGGVLDQWHAPSDAVSFYDGAFPKGTQHVHVEGVDAAGTTLAIGDASVSGRDAVCVCVALVAQHPVVCQDVVCHVFADECAFTDGAGAPIGARSFWFGENSTDDIHGVTTDTYLEGKPGQDILNHGGEPSLEASSDTTSPKTGLLRFDLGPIPTTAHVVSAALAMTVTIDDTSTPVELYPVLEDWEAGTGQNVAGCSNWTCRTTQGGQQLWTTPGAGAPGSSSDTLTLAMSLPALATRYEESTDTLAAQIESWAADAGTNRGFALRFTPAGHSLEVGSSEGTDGARPELRVELTLPDAPP